MQIELRKDALITFVVALAFVLVDRGSALAAPPTIGGIPDQILIEDHPTGPLQLALSDDVTPILSLVMSGVSDNQDVVPNENIFFGSASGAMFTTVTPAFGRKSGTATITVTVTDGSAQTATTNFTITVVPPPPGSARFYNSSAITIPTDGAATPYPSTINVTGRSGTITNLTLTMSKFTHNRVQDVNMILVSPATNMLVFSHISGAGRGATNVTVHLSDAAFFPLPIDFWLWSEPLWPTAYQPVASFPAPAPVSGPYGTNRFAPIFNGTQANGTWSLYVYDDVAGVGGSIASGWSLMIATSGGGSLPPQMSDITNRVITINTNTGAIAFTVDDGDTSVSNLTLFASSSNTNLVTTNNIVFGGSGTNRTVTVTPVTNQTGTATITVTVSDGTNSANDSFVLTVSAPPTQVRVETAADGSGTVVPAQNINPNSSITVYAISRDVFSNFVANVAADSWSLTNVTGGVTNSDLVVAGNSRSATFTGHVGGSAKIHVTSGALTPTDSGTLTVLASAAPTITPIPDKTTLVERAVGPFYISISDADTPLSNLILSGSSSNQTLVPNGNIILYNDGGGTQTATVAPTAGQTGTSLITVTVSDGINSNSTSFLLTVNPSGSGTTIFDNTNVITISNAVKAVPYPSTNHVTGMAGVVTNVTITLKDMNHSVPHDLEMLLVGPTGQKAVIFAHAGGGTLNNVTVTLDDRATFPLPPLGYAILAGTYDPTDFGHDTFPSNAPSGPYGSTMSSFNGASPNGDWLLYIFNDPTGIGSGTISRGWSLAISTDGGGSLPPQMSDITNRVITINTNTGAIAFTVDDGDTSVSNLTLFASSSNTNLVTTNNIVFGGSGTNRTVTVTPVTNQTGTATITVTVSDGTNSANDSFVLTVSAPPTQVRVETAADGSGTVVPAQNINPNSSITVYAISRDVFSNFVANVAADSWSLTNVTGGVTNSDLVVAGNSRSATFTGHVGGSAKIHVTSGALTPTDSGTLTVLASAAPTITPIPDKTTLVERAVGPFYISISDADTPLSNLILSGSSSNQTLVPNGNIILYNDGGGTQTATVAPTAGQTGTSLITVTVSDGINSNSTSFLLTVNPSGSGTTIFDNTNVITISNAVKAVPYPSTNHVTGMAGVVTNVTITLKDMNHSVPHDLEMLLVGPTGQKAVIFAHAGGGTLNNVTVTLDDRATFPLPPLGYAILAGTYDPTDFGHDTFPSNAPSGPYGSTMSSFNGASPNGDWLLYIFNDPTGIGSGTISRGWSLAISTDTPDTAPTISDIPDQFTIVNTPTNISFTIDDVDTGASNLILTAESSNSTLVTTNNIVFGGSGTNRTVTVTPITNQTGTATITVTVSDGILTASNSFVLTVEPRPLTVTANNTNKVYGSTLTLNGAAFTLTGALFSGDTLTNVALSSAGTAAGAAVGTYPIIASNAQGTGLTNYLITYVDGILTVTLSNLNQSVTTPEDTSTNLVLSSGGIAAPVFAILTEPTNGVRGVLNTNTGGISYTPAFNYNGPDSFQFTVSDGSLLYTGTVSITVFSVNDGPLANSQSVTNAEDTTFAITLTGSDVDGPVTNYVVTVNPAFGTLSGSAPNLTYRGNTNYFGTDSFSFRVNDGSLTSAVATVSITLSNINDTPVADDQSVTNAEDTTFAITLTGSDVDGPVTNYVVTVNPAFGTLGGVAPNLTYRGNTNYFGTDSFSFRVNDGSLTSAVATVSITLSNINDTPVADDQSVTNAEDTTFAITLTGSDVDGPVTNYVVTVNPAFGTLGGVAPNLTYRGNTNYFGTDSFSFRVNDGSLTSAVATVSITLSNINDTPVADDQSVTNAEDTTFAITLTGSDVDGPVTNYVVTVNPAFGTLSGSAPNLTYRGNTNYFGTDSFSFRVNDGSLTSAVATVSITLSNINDTPVADDQSVTNAEDTTFAITLTGSDVDGPVTNYVVTVNPAFGTLGGVAPNLTYRGNTNYFGTDSFSFRVNDGSLTSAVATVSITLSNINDTPVADDQSVTNAEDTTFAITLTGSDVDGPVTNYVVTVNPAFGTLGGVAPNLTYRGNTNYFGTDSFSFRVNDGSLTSAVATVSITLSNINDTPVADDQSVTNAEDTTFAITLTGSDVDGPVTNYVVTVNPAFGTLGGTAPNLTYRGNTNYFGTDSFSFRVNDGSLTSAVATVSITLSNINDVPLADTQSVTNAEDTTFAIILTGSDVDGPVTNYVVTVNPAFGTLGGVAPNLTYRGNTNYFGVDSFSFRVNDGSLTSAVATVSITLSNINDTPVADDQSVTNAEDTTFAITLTGSDVDGPVTNYVVTVNPAFGTLGGVAPNLTYRGNTNYFGVDSFSFRVNDGSLTSAVATVSITLSNINDTPVADDQSVTNAEDTTFAITLTGSDVDGPVTNYVVTVNPAFGTLGGTAPNLTYRGNTNYFGVDSFSFRVNDGSLTSAVATVSITLSNINDVPLADTQSVTNAEDTTFAITLTGSDVDGPVTNYVVTVNPAFGTLGGTAPNLTYRGNTNYFGVDSFSFRVNDGSLTSAVATVSITLSNINDVPIGNNQSVTNAEDTTFAITLTGSDVDGPVTNYVVTVNPAFGTLSGSAPNLTYRGNTNYFGVDSFSFRVNDGSLTSAVAVVSITLSNINDVPIGNNQSVTNAEDTTFAITLTGSDVDGPVTNFVVTVNPAFGTLSGSAPNLTYRGNTNYFGVDSFSFRVNDGSLTSAVATVSITLSNINDVPLADTQSVTNAEDTTFAITLTGSDVDGPVTNYVVTVNPAFGTLGGTAPNLTYRGNTNYFGVDSFSFRVNDGSLTSAVATVSITLSNINDVPLADTQSVTNAEDTTFAITLTGSDVDGPVTNFVVTVNPAFGTLGGTAPNLTYRGNTNYFGVDSFSFRVNDGSLTSAVAVVSITLSNINDVPIGNNQSVTNAEDTTFAITLTGSDVDGPVTNFVVTVNPAFGTLGGTAPNLTYRGNTNYFGVDSFSFRVNDGSLTSAVATVSITLSNINDTPVADDQSVTNAEDTTFAITLTGSDVDGPVTNYVVTVNPAFGTLSGSAPNLTYRGNTNYFGTDSFSFRVNDGSLTSAVATVSITLSNINDVPIGNNQSVTNAEDTTFAITLTGSDVDGPVTNYVVTVNPAFGTLSGSAPNLTYRGNTNYFGTDSFSFRVNDGSLTSAVATVSITLSNINDVPLADTQSVTNAEDTTFAITLTGSDVDGPVTNFVVTVNPAFGTLGGTAPNLTYRGNTNYFGVDSFSFRVNDGSLTSAVAVVSITLSNINDVPIGNNQSVTNAEDTTFAITLTGSDVDGPVTNFVVTVNPAFGTLGGTAPNLTYRGNTNYFGVDSFSFRVNDGSLTSAVATVSITLSNINDTPVADDQSVTNAEDTTFAITLTGSDVDGPVTNYVVTVNPAFGTLSGSAPNLTYRGNTNYFGVDSFSFRVNDGSLTSAVATVSITLSNINDVPIGNNQSVTNAEDTTFAITLTGSDVDGPVTNYVVTVNPAFGTLSGSAPNLTYRGNTNYFGTDSFSFRVNDGSLTSAVATVSITLSNINDTPVADDQSVTNAEDTTFAITLTGSDVDGPVTNFVVTVNPAFGTLGGSAPNLTYRGNTNYFGTDSFSFRVNDGSLTSAVAVVSITLSNINDVPIGNNQSVTNAEDTTFAITLTGSDVDGPVTNYVVTVNPAFGTLGGTAPNLTYRGNTNYFGTDSFSFRVNDGSLTSAVAVVSITLSNINDVPIGNNQSVTNAEDTTFAITLTGSDVDGPVTNYVVTVNPAFGTLSGSAPNLTYRGNTNYFGVDSFSFRVNDGSLTSAVAVVSITLSNINDVPIGNNQSVTNAEDTTFAITLTGSDVDGPVTNYVVTVNPAFGTLSGSAPNLTYRGNTNYFGVDSFSFRVNDGSLTSAVAVVSITLSNINDTPVADDQSVTNAEDTTFAITLTGSDVDGPVTNYVVTVNPAFGTLSGSAPNLTYRGNTNYFGVDSFSFRVNDGSLTSAVAVVSITLSNINDVPIGNNQSVTNAEDTTFAITLTGSDVDGPVTNYVVTVNPAFGTLSGSAPNLTYRGNTNYFGVDSFSFRVNDGSLTSAVATVSITLSNINDVPIGNNQSVTNAEDTTFAITLTGSDVDGPVTNYVVTVNPAFGTLSGSAPNLTYRGNTNYFGTDSFSFRVNDGSLTSAVATVSITLSNINDTPVADDQSVTNAEDTTFAITLTGSDVDGPVTNFVVTVNPAFGTLGGTAPNLTYRGNTNYFGTDSFSFRVNDGSLTSAVAVVSITLSNINDVPIGNNQSVTNAEDTTFAITLTGSDVDGPVTNYVVTVNPAFGTLGGTAPNLTYRGNTNYFGTDSFSFRVNDGSLTSAVAVVSITLSNINDVPIGNNQSVTNAEDTTFAITLTGSDVDGPVTNYVVTVNPAFGTLSGSAPNLTYRGNTNYFGVDSFSFRVNDGSLTSAVAVVSITLSNINDVPIGNNQSVTNAEDTTFAITLTGSDVDGPVTNYVVTVNPAFGTLSGSAPNLTYRGNTNYFGVDSFSFRVNDGSLTSAVAVVSITLSNINDTPVADDQSVTNAEDTTFAITLTGSDVDGPVTNYVVTVNPAFGTLSGSAPNLTYRGNTNYFGVDSFSFRVNDGSLTSAVAVVSITLSNINDVPIGNNQSVTNAEDTTFAITLTGSDVDGPVTNYVVTVNPAFGTLSGSAPNLTYRGNTNYFGVDSFSFRVNDGSLTSAVATVSITLSNINDVPIGNNQSVTNAEDTTFAITLTGSDVDGPVTNYVVTVNPAFGTLSGSAPNLTYRGNTNYFGTDSFSFRVNDGSLTSAVATVSITLSNINDTPVADDQSVTNAEDTTFAITLTGSDVDGPVTNFVVTVNPAFGTLGGTAPNLTYRGNTNYFGTDSFSFRVNDGSLTSAVAVVSITLSNINDVPIGNNQSVTNAEDTTFAITLTGSDVDGPVTNYVVTVNPAFGTLGGTAPNLTYRGNTNYFGTDSFSFRVNDGSLTSAVAVVSITLSNINDVPIGNNQSVTNAEDTTFAITLTGSDVDGPVTNYVVTVNPAFGTLSGSAPNLTYRGNTNYFGVDSFSFRVNDGSLTSAVAVVSITLSNINDVPIGNNQSVTNAEDTTFAITLTGSDVDGPVTNYVVTVNPAFGTLSGSAPNLTYRGNTNYFGVDSFSFRVNDGSLTSAVATVSITLSNINDVPLADTQSVTNAEDTTFAIILTGSDVDGPVTNFVVTVNPAFGTLGGTAPNLTYRGNTNYFGVDSFSFRVNDGSLTSAVAVVSITLSNINDVPIGNNQSVTNAEDTTFAITLTGSDVDGPVTNFVVTVNPAFGTLGGTAPNLTYRGNTNYFGVDSFSFRVNDGSLTSAVAVVSITLSNINDTPVADDQSVTNAEDTTFAITLTGSDVDGPVTNYVVTVNPAFGTLSGSAPNLTYRGNTNYFGVDSFSFRVNDGSLTSAVAVVSITLSNINDVPIGNNQSVTNAEDTTFAITLTGSDVDGPVTNFVVTVNPAFGTLGGTAPNLTYRGNTNYFGVDSFSFRVNDGSLTSAVAVVSITLSNINDTPVADDQSVTNAEDTTFAITLTGSDVDGPVTNYVVTVNPAFGTLGGVAPNLTYRGNTNYFGTDSFSFRVNDGSLTSAVAVVSITLSNINDVPLLTGQTNRTINEETLLMVTNTASNVDLPVDSLSYALLVAPTNAVIDADGVITWTPTEAQGPSTNVFTTVVTDNWTPSLSATNSFSVIVNEVNVAPTLPWQADRTVQQWTSMVVTNAASDADIPTNGLSYQLTGPGGADINSHGVISWTPGIGTGGTTKTFTTVVTDNGVPVLRVTNSFKVTVNNGENSAPVLPVQTNHVVNEQTLMVVTNTGIDSNIPADDLSYALVVAPTNAVINSNGVITWTPTEAQGPSTNVFTTVVTDDGTPHLHATNSFTVVVNEVNSTPIAVNQGVTTLEDTTTNLVLTATDADIPANVLNYAILSGPANGVLGILNTNSGALSYTPNVNYNGPDAFQFTVNDGGLLSTGTVSITVIAVNNGPVANNQSVTNAEDTTFAITLTGSDVDGPVTNYVVTVNPVFGTLSGSAPNLTYRGNTNYFGTDSFSFRVNDGSLTSAVATVSITLSNINDAPVLPLQTNRTISVMTSLIVSNMATDIDTSQNLLNYTLSGPVGATITNGVISWTPSAAQAGSSNTFTTVVTDDGGLGTTNTFAVVVTGSNYVFQITSIVVSNGAAVITWDSLAGQTYRLQYKNNLSDTSWTDIAPDVTATGPTTSATNSLGGATQRFYRVAIATTPPETEAANQSIVINNGMAIISWDSVAGQTYRVQYKDGLAEANWTDIVPDVTATGPRTSATNALNGSQLRFYRVTVVTTPAETEVANQSIVINNGQAIISWDSVVGQTYRVQYKDGLAEANWTDIVPDVTATGTETSTTNALNGSQLRFYRVIFVVRAFAPAPVLQSIGVTNGIATISWSAVAGRSYRLQCKTNITGTNWSDVLPDIVAGGPTASATNSVDGTPQKFYRVGLLL